MNSDAFDANLAWSALAARVGVHVRGTGCAVWIGRSVRSLTLSQSIASPASALAASLSSSLTSQTS
jgi:hypothetical protein